MILLSLLMSSASLPTCFRYRWCFHWVYHIFFIANLKSLLLRINYNNHQVSFAMYPMSSNNIEYSTTITGRWVNRTMGKSRRSSEWENHMIVQLCQLVSITSLQLTGYPLMFSLLLSESVTKLYNRFICHGWHVNDMFLNSNKNNYHFINPPSS